MTKKLLDRTVGQGNIGYDGITFANHSDYHKRNNAQRGIANNPVFKVKGQFVGMLLLFVRTHEFLERSVIYYNDRADLIGFKDGQFVNLSPRLGGSTWWWIRRSSSKGLEHRKPVSYRTRDIR